ncbi:MAG: hypothetical protein FWG20_05725 [Candidatus Cloacimonetes bacterium]|nr:hypothetical protein [Candidatus Cloacimonadota bacterium]
MRENINAGRGIDPCLLEIMKIQTVSRNQTEMANYILKRLAKIESVDFECDMHGNIIATKGVSGDYICLCCHQDTVHPIRADYQIRHDKHIGELYAVSGGTQVGIGGDDKCGVYAILNIIENCEKPVKVVFFADEEIGCIGSNNIDIEIFDDVSLLIGIDRRGDSDLITEYHGDTISQEYRNFIIPISKKYGYAETHGLTTDVFTIQKRIGWGISAINVSCGFFNPHTDQEYIKISALYNCIDFVKRIIETRI